MAATGIQAHGDDFTLEAENAIDKYEVVGFGTAAGLCDVFASNASGALGFAADDAAAGQDVRIISSGVARAVAGAGGVTLGDALVPATGGTVITAPAGAGVDDYIIGYAMETASATEAVSVFIKHVINAN